MLLTQRKTRKSSVDVELEMIFIFFLFLSSFIQLQHNPWHIRNYNQLRVMEVCCVCGIHSGFMDVFLFSAILSWILLRLSEHWEMSFKSVYRFSFLIDPPRDRKTRINQEIIETSQHVLHQRLDSCITPPVSVSTHTRKALRWDGQRTQSGLSSSSSPWS